MTDISTIQQIIASDLTNPQVSLSHGSAFIFDGLVAHDTLNYAVATCMDRYYRYSSPLWSCFSPYT